MASDSTRWRTDAAGSGHGKRGSAARRLMSPMRYARVVYLTAPAGPSPEEAPRSVRGGYDVLPDERVVPGAVVFGRQPEGGGIRGGLVSVAGRQRALVAGDGDEFRHRRAEAAALVRLTDVHTRGQHLVVIRQFGEGGRLVRYQRADLLRVLGHQGQRVDGAAAAGEDVHRSGVQRGDQPVQVVGVLVRGGLGGAVGATAAVRAAGVVGDDRPVGEMAGQGHESAGAHRRSDDQQDWVGAGVVAPDVVGQHGARHVQGVRLRVGHGCPLRRVLGSYQ